MAQTGDKKIPGKDAAILIVSLKSQFPIQQAIGLEVMMKPKLSGYLGFGQFSRFYTTVALNALPNKKVEQLMRRQFIKDNLRDGTVFETGLAYHFPKRRKFYAGLNFQNQHFTLPSTTQQLVENYDFLDGQGRKDKILDLVDKNARLREFYETTQIISKVTLQRLGITLGRRFGFSKIPRFGFHTELSAQWNIGSRTAIESSSPIGNVLIKQFAEPILQERTQESFSSFFLPSLTLRVSYDNIPASIRSLSTGNVSSSFHFGIRGIRLDVYFKNQTNKTAMSLFRKSIHLIAGVLIFWRSVGYGQAEITGKWLSQDGDRKMEIYEINGSYSGKIIWLKSNTGKVRVGDIVMKNIIYKNDHWEGSAYIPARDRDLPVSISMPGDDELEITGKVGMISRTKRWKRCK